MKLSTVMEKQISSYLYFNTMETFYSIEMTQREISVIISPRQKSTITYFTMLSFNLYYLTSVAVGCIIFFSLAIYVQPYQGSLRTLLKNESFLDYSEICHYPLFLS